MTIILLTPHKVIWILEYNKFLPVESRVMGFGIHDSALGVQKPANNWNPESKFHCQRLESTPGIRNPRLVIQIQVCLRFPHTGRTIFRGRFVCR